MKILCTFHHEQLHESLVLLGARMGADVYRPLGLDWYHEDLWHVHPSEATANQYLGGATYLNYKGVTLDEAKKANWGLIITTLLDDYPCMEKFRKDHCPNAKHVLQVGNQWDLSQLEGLRNVLNSTTSPVDDNVHSVQYHPEFTIRPWKTPGNVRSAASFVHCPDIEAIAIGKDITQVSGWPVKFHGAGAFHGAVGLDRILDYMSEFGFLLHHKPGADGYGFVIHQAIAHGMPVIVNLSDYWESAAGKLLYEDTCIDTGSNIFDIVEALEAFADNYTYHQQCCKDAWMEHCNPHREFSEKLKPFFETLK